MTAVAGRRVDSGPGEEEGQARQESGRGLSKAVVWIGITLGTALAILAITNGALLRVGGMPHWLGVILGVEDNAVVVNFRSHHRRVTLPCAKLAKL